MPYFTTESVLSTAARVLGESRLAANTANASAQLSTDSTSERLAPVPAESAGKPVIIFDIFLSHSSLDQLHVLGIYKLLRRRGYRVYLDQTCDPQLNRAVVTRATARVLRYRMAQCKSLFIATSSNTTQSKWVPWELGFMDGWNSKTAILPILPAGTYSFTGQEYFELYSEVRDAGSGYLHPNDLDIFDRGTFIASWGNWLSLPRTF
ncbi:MAG TPA: TIR domain-containing protein [Chthoniobacterales bacterium]|nr:TIR domain-containing protein [Chthoniobacterales bacterium]